MDLDTVGAVVQARTRADLDDLQDGDAVIAGGTWLLSEPQITVRRLVDITTLGWPPVAVDDSGVELAATCTVERLSRLAPDVPADWAAAPLFHDCCTALLASFKVWKTATVGGNICLSLPAGSMISLGVALDATVTVWQPGGGEYSIALADFVTGAGRNVLSHGEVLRSMFLPAPALRGRTVFRKASLAPLGRSGAVVVGRLDHAADGGALAITLTGSTVKPVALRFSALPGTDDLDAALATIPPTLWHDDAHGAPDWRAAVTAVLAHEVRAEFA